MLICGLIPVLWQLSLVMELDFGPILLVFLSQKIIFIFIIKILKITKLKIFYFNNIDYGV